MDDSPGDGIAPTTLTVELPLGPRRGRAVATPDDVLHLDEAKRTWLFGLFVFALVGGVIAALPLLGGDPIARWVHTGGLGVAAIAAIWILVASRDAARYRPWHNIVFGHACVVAIATGFYFWGPLSAALLVVPFGAFIFSVGQSFSGAVSITGHLILAHAAISIAITLGVVTDRSIIPATHLSTSAQLATLALVHAIFLMTFLIARQIRGASRSAIEQLDSALRVLGQREAQLVEAQVGLREVVQAGGPGRFTDQDVGGLRLGALIGRGAMGEVYEASRPDSDVRFAVKLLHPHVVADPKAYERFAREARATASLDAPNVVKVIDVSREGAMVPYLVMERLEGTDLATLLQTRPALELDETVELVEQLAAALAAAHRAGIVHRDLKPQNIFACVVEGKRIWKLLDFGVSKLASGEGTLTHGHLVGTPAYMSPEQARGEAVDHRTDVYSLAVVTYRVLTGRPVIAVSDVPAMLHEVCYGMPPRPSSIVAVTSAVDDVLAIGLAKQPADRFASARELADALAAARDGAGAHAIRSRAEALQRRWPWRRPPTAAAAARR